jgi:hypothetical protein
MKRSLGLASVLGIVALAIAWMAPVGADPGKDPCICHHTQWKNQMQGDANENAKVFKICPDKNSYSRLNKHIQHGDQIIDRDAECEVIVCDEETGPFPECCDEFPESCV